MSEGQRSRAEIRAVKEIPVTGQTAQDPVPGGIPCGNAANQPIRPLLNTMKATQVMRALKEIAGSAQPDVNGLRRSIKSLLSPLAKRLNDCKENIYFDNYDFWMPVQNKRLLVTDPSKPILRVAEYVRDGNSWICQSWVAEQEEIVLPNGAPGRLGGPTTYEARNICDSMTGIEKANTTLRLQSRKPNYGKAIELEKVAPGSRGFIIDLYSSNNPKSCYYAVGIKVLHIDNTWSSPTAAIVSWRMVPSFLSAEEKNQLASLYVLIDENLLDIEKNGTIKIKKSLSELLGNNSDLSAEKTTAKAMEEQATKADETVAVAASGEARESTIHQLLNADYIRADITPETEQATLRDPATGHWELWELLKQHEKTGGQTVPLQEPVYARSPKSDVQWDGLIGIDFGTKSTVVAMITDSLITTQRIGTGDLTRDVTDEQYENPTMLEFCNLDRFLEEYQSKKGRPLTRWEDLTTSYTALENRNNLSQNKGPRYLPAFFGDLKQWAGGARQNIHIVDRQSIDNGAPGKELKPFQELVEGDLDPIELYAYYIGLYINNMRNGVFLNYLLSYPVNYSKEIRERIRGSFERGLRKSLPESILEDEDCQKVFSVELGASEPACYAVCALKRFGYKPTPKQPIRFAVYDFGGGTSDFDIGEWRRPQGDERGGHIRYVIEHVRSGGADHLGGENLLWEMAFRTFSHNEKQLRENRIQFTCPKWCTPGRGFETLISNSKEAQTNTRTLCETLRPIWEGRMDEKNCTESEHGFPAITDGVATAMPLFTQDTKQTQDLNLTIPVDELRELIQRRINEGIEQFDALLHNAAEYWNKKNASDRTGGKTDQMVIVLAGNSSKSEIIQSSIRERLKELNESARQKQLEKGIPKSEVQENTFELIPPLGTDAANKKLIEFGREEYDEFDELPRDCTGKNGVAIGILCTRDEGNILVKDISEEGEEVPFRFWVGNMAEDRDVLRPLLSPDSNYNTWVEAWRSDSRRQEFRWTNSQKAGSYEQIDEYESKGGVPISSSRRETAHIPPEAIGRNYKLYLRPDKPNEFSYAVAKSLECANDGEFVLEPQKVTLNT